MEEIFLETKRLILREMDEKDFGELAKILKNPRVMYAWEYDFDDNDVFGWIKKNKEYYKKYNLGYFLAIEKQSSEIVGQFALLPDIIDGKEYYEAGYILKEEFWHNGFAREGTKGIVDYAFNKLKLDSIIFEIRPENKNSIHVAEYLGANVTGEFLKNVRGRQMKHLIYTLKK